MSTLKGKVAVVTGASKGIGAAIAKKLADDGASVVVNYASSKAGADAVVAAIEKAGGKAVAVQGRRFEGRRSQRHRRRRDREVRPARHSRQQLRHLRVRRDRESRRGELPQAVQHERARAPADDAGCGEASGRGREHHQHRLGRLDAAPAAERGLHGHQGRGRRDHRRARQGARRAARSASTRSRQASSKPKARIRRASSARSSKRTPSRARRSAAPGQPNDIASIASFLASNDSSWMTGERLIASGGLH